MTKNTLIIDFETYYEIGAYSLKKLPVSLYIRDKRFFVFGCGVKLNNEPTKWVEGKDLTAYFSTINWGDTTVVAHNCHFDGAVLVEHFGIHPANWVDTVGLARPLLPGLPNYSLDALGQKIAAGTKGDAIRMLAGKKELTKEESRELQEYCKNDVRICHAIYKLCIPALPVIEQKLLHLTVRMSVEATLEINLDTLKKATDEAITKRTTAIQESGYHEEALISNQKFAAILTNLSIELPTKISPTTGLTTTAFSKNDPEFIDTQATYPEYRSLWDARLAAKSNIDITRGSTMAKIGKSGKMPMPLKYYGAHTGRWSGTGGVNVQNLRRGSALRRCIEAPKDHVIVVADSSQIELRLNAWFCGFRPTLDTLIANKDVYVQSAADHFGVNYEDIGKEDPRRAFGKMLELALGYNMGHPKFRTNAAIGFMGTPPINLSVREAQNTVEGWRRRHKEICDMWRTLTNLLPSLLRETSTADDDTENILKCVKIQHEGFLLPNGMSLEYPNLRHVDNRGDVAWKYGYGRNENFIYGGKMLENIIQALARIIVAEQTLLIDNEPNAHVVGMTHDEVISIAKETEAESVYQKCVEIMSTPPSWAPDLPLGAEGGYAKEYSK